ncbi:hypothetical protein BOC58_31955 [Burkholderia pseudomallei]|nr:hypothetical protein BOC58_31955 [Burkholderia pseudomallei]
MSPDITGLGVQIRSKLTANLDHTSFSMNASGVALHDGNVPFRCMGTGSARLAVAALQSAESAQREFLLVDEIEYGLEPHRISLLASHLRKRVEKSGQVFLTTHSVSVLREVRFDEVFVCRRDSTTGEVEVKPAAATATVPLEAKRYVRDLGDALLAKSVLVCEGQTEIALLKGYAEGAQKPFQRYSVALIDGGGSSAPAVALHFASLGYRTALLTDSDAPISPANIAALEASNVPHFEWGDNRCTEEELFLGTPTVVRHKLLALIAGEIGEPRTLGELSGTVGQKLETLQQANAYLSVQDWARPIGKLAHKAKWIKKDFDLCFGIGAQLLAPPNAIDEGSLGGHLGEIFGWLCSDA